MLPLKLPSSQPGDVQPYLEERSESGKRQQRMEEFGENIYSEKLARRLRKKCADLQLLFHKA